MTVFFAQLDRVQLDAPFNKINNKIKKFVHRTLMHPQMLGSGQRIHF